MSGTSTGSTVWRSISGGRGPTPLPADVIGRGTVTVERTSPSTVRVWCDMPWCRSLSSPLDARTARMGSPPRAAAASRTAAASTAVVPTQVPVPTTPGPMPTTMASAPSAARASSNADGMVTASTSPPKAWPAVIVPASSDRSLMVATRSDTAMGSAAPSVIT